MNCRTVSKKIHDYLDSHLAAREVSELEAHLMICPDCRQVYDELSAIQGMISERLKLPGPSSVCCLNLATKKRTIWNGPIPALQQLARDFRSFCRDLSPLFVISRLAALPLTLAFFAALIAQLPVFNFDNVNFPAISMQGWTASPKIQPNATRIFATRSGQTRFHELMDTAWRLPYEDSLSLVAEITPEGRARIEGVLEYPKSNALFDAADQAFRRSEFVADGTSSQVIFSFQKIDVWEESDYPAGLLRSSPVVR